MLAKCIPQKKKKKKAKNYPSQSPFAKLHWCTASVVKAQNYHSKRVLVREQDSLGSQGSYTSPARVSHEALSQALISIDFKHSVLSPLENCGVV